MKIGVITNLDKQNYGSVLQAYALKTKLSELGADSFILKKVSRQKKSPLSRIKRFLKPSKTQYSLKAKLEIKQSRKQYVAKIQKVSDFCKENLEVKVCNTLSEAADIANQCNIMLAGSDQIWSPNAGLLSEFTLLSFGGEKNYTKASYAASIGVSELSDESKELFAKCLADFHTVSLREITGKKLIEKCTDRPLQTDLDPSLLYDRSFWGKIAVSVQASDEPYIFVYMIRPEPVTISLAKKLSEQTGLKIKICSNRIISGDNIENITDAGIEEFLSLMANAKFVVTNSFHGTAFAVQFHRQFLSIVVSGTGSRTNDFLNSVGLSNRIADSENDFNLIDKKIAWNEVDNKLTEKRRSSVEYLNRLINDSSDNRDESTAPGKVLSDDNDCTGCSACMNICPKHCITMKENELGFIYPEIDLDNCINCGLCKKTCPSMNMPKRNVSHHFYGAAAKNNGILNNSASGGAFSVVASEFLEQGGVVFGASTTQKDDSLVVKHRLVDNIDDLKFLQGSKYVQSEINTTYKSAEELLKKGTTVLFSGTPCQIAGLKSFLRKDYEGLYTIEVLCHGVPNNKMFYEYLKTQIEPGSKMLDYRFRSKEKGWIIKIAEIISQNSDGNTNRKFKGSRLTSYYSLFLDSYILRDSCYNCKYACKERCADLTVGDYWGFYIHHKDLIKNKTFSEKSGVSCVLVNTDKGNELAKIISEKCNIAETNFENISKNQGNLKSPAKKPQGRDKLMQNYRKQGYKALEEFTNNIPARKKMLYNIQYAAPYLFARTMRIAKKCIAIVKGK